MGWRCEALEFVLGKRRVGDFCLLDVQLYLFVRNGRMLLSDECVSEWVRLVGVD